MAKPICVTEENIRAVMQDVEKKLRDARVADGIFHYDGSFAPESRQRVNVWFTPGAYIKMFSLVHGYSSEVGWHGTVSRRDDGFLVEDIFIYPQKVTGATVDTDEGEMASWLNGLPEEVFGRLRFHGHSHVNMGVTPSSTDMRHRESFLSQLGPEDFYIFMIVNKRQEWSFAVFDMRENLLYETMDVSVGVTDVPRDTMFVMDQAKARVKDVVAAPKAQNSAPKPASAGKKKKKREDVDAYSFWDEYDTIRDWVDHMYDSEK